jgi:3-hydroxyacyl-[acyl-carrier-protein] dehydratase
MLTAAEVLDLIPQKPPFRFLDALLEIDADHVVGECTYRTDSFFYAGHFPGDPVTPGVILIETMGQTANALMVYLLGLEFGADAIRRLRGAGTDVTIEFESVVLPGETVRTRADKMFWRGRKLRSKVELSREDGELVAHGTIGGMADRVRSAV